MRSDAACVHRLQVCCHRVILLLVGRQHGFIHDGTEQYFIEPVKGHSEVSDDNGHPHLIYRRSALRLQQQRQQPAISKDDVSMCGLEDGGESNAPFTPQINNRSLTHRIAKFVNSINQLSQFLAVAFICMSPSPLYIQIILQLHSSRPSHHLYSSSRCCSLHSLANT